MDGVLVDVGFALCPVYFGRSLLPGLIKYPLEKFKRSDTFLMDQYVHDYHGKISKLEEGSNLQEDNGDNIISVLTRWLHVGLMPKE
jgi:hypothetical protein